MIPSSHLFDHSVMTALLDHDPVVEQYRAFFSHFAWSVVDDWHAQRSTRGRPGHAETAYIKAFLVRQNEGFTYTSQLRRFLLTHPLLVIELGFHLVLDLSCPYGFDVEATLPCRYWLTQNLHLLDRTLSQDLLHARGTRSLIRSWFLSGWQTGGEPEGAMSESRPQQKENATDSGRTLIDVATALRGSRPSRCASRGTYYITASFVLM